MNAYFSFYEYVQFMTFDKLLQLAIPETLRELTQNNSSTCGEAICLQASLVNLELFRSKFLGSCFSFGGIFYFMGLCFVDIAFVLRSSFFSSFAGGFFCCCHD